MKNAIGTKTADSTIAIPIRAPVICCMDFWVASLGGNPLFTHNTFDVFNNNDRIIYQSPIASTIANIVSVLILKPKADKIPKVPKRTTGTAIVGINVA